MSRLIIVFTLAVALLKAGFLVWVFVRTRKLAAIAYLLSLNLGGVPYVLIERFFSPASVAEGERLVFILLMTKVADNLLETLLFIWLVRSVMRRTQIQPSITDAL